MVDTLTRLAGPTIPAKGEAGTTIYDPSTGTIVIRNATFTNVHAGRGAWAHLSIGDMTVPANRIISGLYVPPGETIVVPLDLVMAGATEDIRARQIVDQAGTAMNPASATALIADSTDATTYTTATWTAISGAEYLLFAYARAATTPAISSFTDTHSGITWTLVDSVTGLLASNIGKLVCYRAHSTGTTNTTTAVVWTATMQCGFVSIISLEGGDASGTHGSECIQKSGAAYRPTTSTTVEVFGALHCGGRVFAGSNQQSTGATTAGGGFTEIHDGTTATPATAFESSYSLQPGFYGAGLFTTGVERLALLVNIQDDVDVLNVTLNGVVVT